MAENLGMANRGDDGLESPKKGEVVSAPNGKTLHIRKGQEGVNFRSILAQLSQYVNIGQAVASIEKTKQYVVEVPLQYQEAFNSGKYFINHNKSTGVMWPSLMEIRPDGRWGFVDNLPIVEQELVRGNPMRDISMNIYNIALQQQIDSLADAVERTYRAVERIEHGQIDDRIAILYSGREQIRLALTLKDDNEKKRAISLARQSLNDAKYQVGLTLKRRIEEFEPLPEGGFKLRMLAFRNKDILNQRDDEVQEIQNYYELYLEATKLLAASYLLTQDKDAALQVYESSVDFIKTIQFQNIRTIEFVHNKEEIQDTFLYHPVSYIEAEREEAEEDAKEYEHMIIEVSGEDLLEVVDNDGEI